MLRVVRAVVALICVVLFSAGAAVYGQHAEPTRFEGRRLDEALTALQKRGLKIIYSSEVVLPHMRVRAQPRVTSLRRILDELLSEQGLIARDGPGGNVLIVKNPRARLARSPAPLSSDAPSGDTVELPRFEETVQVTDAHPRDAGAGPPPAPLRPLDVRGLAGGLRTFSARCRRCLA